MKGVDVSHLFNNPRLSLIRQVPRTLPTAHLVLISIIAAYCAVIGLRPIYNWDLIPYVAITLSPATHINGDTHDAAYDLIRRRLPESQREELLELSAFRHTMAADATSFRYQLPFYWPKVGYWLTLKAFTAVTGDLIAAAYLLSMLGSCVLIAVVFLWAERAFGLSIASLFAVAVAAGDFVLGTGRTATPDALANAFVLCALLSLIDRQRHAPIIFGVSAVLVRPDKAIVFGVLALAALVRRCRKHEDRTVLLVALAAIVVAGAISQTLPYYGWTALFFNTFLGRIYGPGDIPSAIATDEYLRVAFDDLPALVFTLIPFIVVAVWCCRVASRRGNQVDLSYVSATITAIVVMYLAYPDVQLRFTYPLYVFMSLVLIRGFVDAHGTGFEPFTPRWGSIRARFT